ncbi:MAG: tyrosyl-tRNA synthetase [Piccolia ochrophora]|nr:MAG: tyrosyl-tRNA synthetase [Piccolia ochrophora]
MSAEISESGAGATWKIFSLSSVNTLRPRWTSLDNAIMLVPPRPFQYICRSCARNILRTPSKRWLHQRYLARHAKADEEWQEKAREIEGKQQKSMLSILEERGYIDAIAGNRDELDKLMTRKRVGAYVGFDPTAPSLHLGHLLPMMALVWLYVHGFHVVSLLGGATAKIGDPTGRTSNREDPGNSVRKACMVSMHYQLKTIWANAEHYGRTHGYYWEYAWQRELCNNNSWLNKVGILEVLQVMGPGVRLGAMLGKDTVRTKMESRDGMSFSEFTYPVLQAWDWWHMYQTKNIQLQIGGSDQFGNIVAGIDAVKYVKKTHHNPDVRQEKDDPNMTPFGFTVPLLTTASGQKFGKSEGNAIWLDKDMTSTFDLYQYFLRLPDADIHRYLKLFTLLPLDDISHTMTAHEIDPSQRKAQHLLAREVVHLVHGEAAATDAEAQHRAIFGQRHRISPSALLHDAPTQTPSDTPSSSASPLPASAQNTPPRNITLPRSLVVDKPFTHVLHSAGLATSRSEAHRMIHKQRGVYVGHSESGQVMGDEVRFAPIREFWEPAKTAEFVQEGGLLVMRVGKWKVKIVRVVDDEEFERDGGDAPGWREEVQRKKTARFREGVEGGEKAEKWEGGED